MQMFPHLDVIQISHNTTLVKVGRVYMESPTCNDTAVAILQQPDAI